MKSFHDFVCLKEEDGMPPAQNQMNPAANQMPPTGPSPEGQNPGQETDRDPPPEAAEEMEGITNDIQRQVHRLFQVLHRHNLNKNKTATLLTAIIQQVAGGGKLSATGANQTTRNAMTTNGSGMTPPMQPMANG
jgi:hypothetical protein